MEISQLSSSFQKQILMEIRQNILTSSKGTFKNVKESLPYAPSHKAQTKVLVIKYIGCVNKVTDNFHKALHFTLESPNP